MGSGGFVGVEGVAQKIKSIYIGVNGVAQEVKNAYVGVEGVAELVYSGRGPGYLVLSDDEFDTYTTESVSLTVVSASGVVSGVTVSDPAISAAVVGDTIIVTSNENNTGNYTVTIHVDQSENYDALDLTVPVVVMEKQTGFVTLSGNSFNTYTTESTTLNVVSSSGTVTGVTASDPAISASVSGNVITVTSNNSTAGNYTVTVHAAESAAYKAADVSFPVVISEKMDGYLTLNGSFEICMLGGQTLNVSSASGNIIGATAGSDDITVTYTATSVTVRSAKTTNGTFSVTVNVAESYAYKALSKSFDVVVLAKAQINLSMNRYGGSSAKIGNYVLFVGSDKYTKSIETVDNSLVKGTVPSLETEEKYTGGASASNYAVFNLSWSNKNIAYNSSLVRTDLAFGNVSSGLGEAVGDKAIFIRPGVNSDYTKLKVEYYNGSLTRSYREESTSMTSAETFSHANNGSYAMFCITDDANDINNNVAFCYNSSLTRSLVQLTTKAQHSASACRAGNYVLFAGGDPYPKWTSLDTVETINTSLTRGTAPNLGQQKHGAVTADSNNKAYIAAGYFGAFTGNRYDIDIYNSSLVKSSGGDVSRAMGTSRNRFYYNISIGIGDYVLLAGESGYLEAHKTA